MTLHKPLLLASCLPLLAATAWSAPPDAGSLLREELQREQPRGPAMPPRPESTSSTRPVADAGAKITVTAFRLIGLTSLPESEAQAVLSAYLGRPLSMAELQGAAAKLEQWLRSRGLFVARAYVPPQDIKDGTVDIRIVEGQVEGIDIKRAPNTRLSEDKLRAPLAHTLPPGTPLEQERLERGLLLLNDLPATSARAVLVPGKEAGTSRVMVEAAQGPIASGTVELDNTGNRFTGAWRLGASLAINDAYGLGDQWSLRVAASEGSSFVRLGYTLPIGADGWKVGLALIDSRYRLCCADAATTLNAKGSANAFSAFASYPLIRTRLSNLWATASLARRNFEDRSLGVTTSDKDSNTLSLGVHGDLSNLSGQGAFTTYGAQWVSGRMNLDGWAADRAQDAVTAQTHGSFNKISGQVTHLMRVAKSSAVFVGLSGQWASKNLDSSEKFVLGGPQGVRAYPNGEASGDEGWLLNLEWRQEITPDWQGTLFVDHGGVKLNHSPWANWNAAMPNVPNRYTLSGAGFSLAWSPTQNSRVTATVASRLGHNPGRDALGRNSDNRSSATRFWLQGSIAF